MEGKTIDFDAKEGKVPDEWIKATQSGRGKKTLNTPYSKSSIAWRATEVFAAACKPLGRYDHDLYSALLLPDDTKGDVPAIRLELGSVIHTAAQDMPLAVILQICVSPDNGHSRLVTARVSKQREGPGAPLFPLVWSNVADEKLRPGAVLSVVGNVRDNDAECSLMCALMRSWDRNHVPEAVARWETTTLADRGGVWKRSMAAIIARDFAADRAVQKDVTAEKAHDKLVATYLEVEWPPACPWREPYYERVLAKVYRADPSSKRTIPGAKPFIAVPPPPPPKPATPEPPPVVHRLAPPSPPQPEKKRKKSGSDDDGSDADYDGKKEKKTKKKKKTTTATKSRKEKAKESEESEPEKEEEKPKKKRGRPKKKKVEEPASETETDSESEDEKPKAKKPKKEHRDKATERGKEKHREEKEEKKKKKKPPTVEETIAEISGKLDAMEERMERQEEKQRMFLKAVTSLFS